MSVGRTNVRATGGGPAEHGSVLIIVLWVAFGLVSLSLYFAHSMTMQLRTADNRAAAIGAIHAINGAMRYATNLVATQEEPGGLPDRWSYPCEAVPVGEATFWLIGRPERQDPADRPAFGLVDEASKLNLNLATIEMLQELPRVTPEVAAAIVDWRDEDSELSPGGAEDETYLRLNPPYRCKNAPFESVEELRLVYGVTFEVLYGEDTNLNGVLDPNENDGEVSPPYDDRDGVLDPGLAEFLTAATREPTMASDGSERLNLAAEGIDQQQIASLLEETFGQDRANQILQALGNLSQGFPSTLEFYSRSGMSAEEFSRIEDRITVSGEGTAWGRVNVNTASETVLACIPGIGIANASTLAASRPANASEGSSLAWLAEALDASALAEAGPYLTGRSYQYCVDIAAVGHFGRGYRRTRFICDTSGGAIRLLAQRELTSFGWALGRETREELLRDVELRTRR
jgi:type II secretory pathway component PulK